MLTVKITLVYIAYRARTWRSLKAYLNGVQGVGGSNLPVPTSKIKGLDDGLTPLIFTYRYNFVAELQIGFRPSYEFFVMNISCGNQHNVGISLVMN